MKPFKEQITQQEEQQIEQLLLQIAPKGLSQEQNLRLTHTLQVASALQELEALSPMKIDAEQEKIFSQDIALLAKLGELKEMAPSDDIIQQWQKATPILNDLDSLAPLSLNQEQKLEWGENLSLVKELSQLAPCPVANETKELWLTAIAQEALISSQQPISLSQEQQRKLLQPIFLRQRFMHVVNYAQKITGIAAVFCLIFFLTYHFNQPINQETPQVIASAVGLTSLENSAWDSFGEPKFVIDQKPLVEIKSYVVNREDQGIVGMEDDQIIRQIKYDVVDEVSWNEKSSNQDNLTFYSQKVPRQEVVYIPEQIN